MRQSELAHIHSSTWMNQVAARLCLRHRRPYVLSWSEPDNPLPWRAVRPPGRAVRTLGLEAPPWLHLVRRPHPWRSQLYLRGRNMTVRQLVGTVKANRFCQVDVFNNATGAGLTNVAVLAELYKVS